MCYVGAIRIKLVSPITHKVCHILTAKISYILTHHVNNLVEILKIMKDSWYKKRVIFIHFSNLYSSRKKTHPFWSYMFLCSLWYWSIKRNSLSLSDICNDIKWYDYPKIIPKDSTDVFEIFYIVLYETFVLSYL